MSLAPGRYAGAAGARAERLGAVLWAIVWAFFPLFQALVAVMLRSSAKSVR